jgi:hypothetical protein
MNSIHRIQAGSVDMMDHSSENNVKQLDSSYNHENSVHQHVNAINPLESFTTTNDVPQIFDSIKIALVCSSNVNRSMEAHHMLALNNIKADSYGVGEY